MMNKWDKLHGHNVTLYQKRVKAEYARAIEKVIKKMGLLPTKLGDKPLSFSDYPIAQKEINTIINELKDGIITRTTNGIREEWSLSQKKNDVILDKLAHSEASRQIREIRTADALDAFVNRKTNGLSLSDRVWNYTSQYRDELENGLDICIRDGLSASQTASRLKQYLVYPDKLFRRVRDIHGVLQLSKNAAAFHPGQGVYRSSYKNARRMVATETNMAYRFSDYQRWQDEPQVVGIEIKLSNNHTLNGVPFTDICDELKGKYPKDFVFTGWHPLCYDKDSEVLTNRGWLHFCDVDEKDLIFSLNPTNKMTEWSAINKLMQWRHRGKMVHFYNRSLDCLVTPDHPMVFLSKSGGNIRKMAASEYRQGVGPIYRSSDYDTKDISRIDIGKLSFPFDVFCEFMGYWLSDGSACRSGQISIAQQDTSPVKNKIIDCIRSMGLQPHRGINAITVYNTELCSYLKKFGKCVEKYIPMEIKESSRKQIRIFLDAFISCDGHIKKPRTFIGNRGDVCHPQGERIYFTTSPQMAADLGELMVKAGKRPSYRVNKCGGRVAHFRNGDYVINHDCYVISECNSATASVFDKKLVDYDDMVYDLELSQNHIMYIRRNGKCFWGSNCRCYAIPILKTDDELIEDLQKIGRGEKLTGDSVNAVKTPPAGFTQWVADNRERLGRMRSLPYFIANNEGFIEQMKITSSAMKNARQANKIVEIVQKKPTALEIAKARHAARTPEQIQGIKDRWNSRIKSLDYSVLLADNYDKDKLVEQFRLLSSITHRSLAGNIKPESLSVNNLRYVIQELQKDVQVPQIYLKEKRASKIMYNLPKTLPANIREKFMQFVTEHNSLGMEDYYLKSNALDGIINLDKLIKKGVDFGKVSMMMPVELLPNSALMMTDEPLRKEFFDNLKSFIPVKTNLKGSHFNPTHSIVQFNIADDRRLLPDYDLRVTYHEYGHALDHQGVFDHKEVSRIMNKWDSFLSAATPQGTRYDVVDKLLSDYFYSHGGYNGKERDAIFAAMDVVQALSGGKYGCTSIDGHKKKYWNGQTRVAEFIAHISEFANYPNNTARTILMDIYEDMAAFGRKCLGY